MYADWGGVLGNHQGGSVYDKYGISPSLIAGMSHGNVVPYILEINKMTDELVMLGQMDAESDHTFECRIVRAEQSRAEQSSLVYVRQATTSGSIACQIGGVADLNYPTSQTRRGRVIDQGNVSPTLTTTSIPSVLEKWIWEIDGVKYWIRIRKLNPRECWRLMDFTDEDFSKAEAVNSNTQLYKQAGNSIVKNVLCEVFGQLLGEQSEAE